MDQSLHVTACYAFVPLKADELSVLQQELQTFGAERKMGGLTLIAQEGINGTVCGSMEAITQWKEHLTSRFGPIQFKDAVAHATPFKRFSVKIKPEIVGLKRPDIKPVGSHRHLTPAQWHDMLLQEDIVVLDARNDYEVAIGKFHGAVDPGIQSFHEFPEAVKQVDLPKDKKILMYCTGGIRCEKALLALEEEGYKDVYQLEGGILAYLEQFPHGKFEGECFVFDWRVAVDQELQPSKLYDICPHCGQPGDKMICCNACGTEQRICGGCEGEGKRMCSKRCRKARVTTRV